MLEALMAISILGFVLVPILSTQLQVTSRVMRMAHTLGALFFGQEVLYQARRLQAPQSREFTFATDSADQAFKAQYVLGPINKKSELSKMDGLLHEIVRVKDERLNRETNLVRFVYKPLPQEKKK